MPLYSVTFDGTSTFIEAESFVAALSAWREWGRIEWGSGYDGAEEPESVNLVSDEPVFRLGGATDSSERVYVRELEEIPVNGATTVDTQPEKLVPLYLDCELARYFYYADDAPK